MSANNTTGEPPERIERKSGGTNYPAIVMGVLLIVVIAGVAGAYEAGYLNKTTTNTVYECPTGDTCTKTTTPNTCTPETGQSVSGAGSTLVAPLMTVWTTDYKNNTVSYNAVGSGTGISDLASKSVLFAASDAPPTSTQNGTFAGQTLIMPESAGAVAFIFNVPGISHLNFNGTYVVSVYEGWITNWNSTMLQTLNPGVVLPQQTIVPVHRSDGSGTTYATTQWMSLQNKEWSSTVSYATTVDWPTVSGEQAEKGNGGVSGYVADNQWTFGYVDLEYALANGISYGAVANPAGHYVLPSIASAQKAILNITGVPGYTLPAGDASWSNVNMLDSPGSYDYPVTTLTYEIYYQNPQAVFGSSITQAQAMGLWNFLNWTISPSGQSYSAANYYVPLSSFILDHDETILAGMMWGSSPVMGCTPSS